MFFATISVFGTIIIFWGCKELYKRWRFVWLSPILSSLVVLSLTLLILHIPYSRYMTGGHWLELMLQPATVAFAVPLYRHLSILKQHAVEILGSVILGSLVAMSSSVVLADLFHIGQLSSSLAPRSVTTPIAMDTSKMIGGNPILTAVFVIITALVGIVFGPWIIRLLKIKSPLARGALFGTGAHVIGTSRAFEMGAMEGTIGSISMLIAAGCTLVVAPWLVPVLQGWLSH